MNVNQLRGVWRRVGHEEEFTVSEILTHIDDDIAICIITTEKSERRAVTGPELLSGAFEKFNWTTRQMEIPNR